MIFKYNEIGKNYLCYIPQTSQAYYVKSKKDAEKFCKKVNLAINNGFYSIIDGKLIKN